MNAPVPQAAVGASAVLGHGGQHAQSPFESGRSTISFVVIGEPKAQPRARSFVLRGKGGRPIMDKRGQPIIRVHEAGQAENWKSQIALAAKEHCPFPPLQGPLRVEISFRFSRPKAHFRSNGELKPTAPIWCCGSRNDLDNLFKAVTDSLTVLGMWLDDGQICETEIMKRYVPVQPFGIFANGEEKPGATITITPLSEPNQKEVAKKQCELAL